jgi:hypothetical protein
MRLTTKQYLGALAILFLAVPIWARSENARSYTAQWFNSQAMTIGNTQISPGDYSLKARQDENMLNIMRDGKVVAQVPCHWIQLPKKAEDTEVTSNKSQIVQVQFAGTTEAIKVDQ